MSVDVHRVSHQLGKNDGLTSLEQQFLFSETTAHAIGGILLTAPLIGNGSIFGDRPGREGERTEESRTLLGFSPVSGFRFDVALVRQPDASFAVRFSQPDRPTPYLDGNLLWSIREASAGAVFDEQINTPEALRVLERPLTGPRPSLRRWLFFRLGHGRVMIGATRSIARLLNGPS